MSALQHTGDLHRGSPRRLDTPKPTRAPTYMAWVDRPTLALDDVGRTVAATRVALGKQGIADERFFDGFGT